MKKRITLFSAMMAALVPVPLFAFESGVNAVNTVEEIERQSITAWTDWRDIDSMPPVDIVTRAMRVTRTITIDGKTKSEYEQIVAHLETEAQRIDGWQIIKEPLVNRVTAVKTEEVQTL